MTIRTLLPWLFSFASPHPLTAQWAIRARLVVGLYAGLGLLAAGAADETALIAALRAATNSSQVWDACQQLRLRGTAQAVPALAPLLVQEATSHAARHALEGMPCPEAGLALREALPKTTGLVKVGIINSLGCRAESESVPLLTPLLADADPAVAAAAAAALGQIGGRAALAALQANLPNAPATVAAAVQEALLRCAERLLAQGDQVSAAAVYRSLSGSNYPPAIQVAAWRGLMLAEPSQRPQRVSEALLGGDRCAYLAALQLVREQPERLVLEACLRYWSKLSPEAAIAVLDGCERWDAVQRGAEEMLRRHGPASEASEPVGPEALPLAQQAGQSPHLSVRVAAWETLGKLGDPAAVPALAKAAARGEPAERDAARRALAQLRGPNARAAFLAHLAKADPPEQAELLRALGERGDREAASVLLERARADSDLVRTAALEALRRLALPETLEPLLGLAAKAATDQHREAILKALYAVVQASTNRDQAAWRLISALQQLPAQQRGPLLPLLAELGTAEALQAAVATAHEPDAQLAKAAVAVLGQWPNAAAAKPLLELARTGSEAAVKTLALRAAVEVAGQEPDLGQRLALFQQARALAPTPAERRLVLGQLAQTPHADALQLALQELGEPALINEAAAAALSIAAKLAPAQPKLADEAARKVLAHVRTPQMVQRAWALRQKAPVSAPFIRHWVVAGPYRQEGVVGADAVFNLVFPPEHSVDRGTGLEAQPAHKVNWRPMPEADSVNLAGLFPGQENCVAYLKTELVVPAETQALLLLGSDDGVKAWLNGQVVHSHNVDRGMAVDQDAAWVHLRPGTNHLVLKVSQGGGGWAVAARLVDLEGQPIPGLSVRTPTAAP